MGLSRVVLGFGGQFLEAVGPLAHLGGPILQLLGPQIERPDARGQVLLDADRRLELPGDLLDIEFVLGIGLAFQGQEVGQLGDLAAQAVERLVAAGQRRAKKELSNHEKHQEKDDGHQQRGQRINETRPDVGAAP